jgi:hypothetical protein
VTIFVPTRRLGYEAALARRGAIEETWEAEGFPLLCEGSTGQMVEHPYVKVLRDHDVLLDKLGARLNKTHAGPDPAAVIKSFRTRKIKRLKAVPKTKTTAKATRNTTG